MAAPKRRQCGTQQVHERLLEMNPAFRERENRIEQGIRRSIERGFAQRVARQLTTIPVVVHVVFKTAAENISDAQVKSQIDVLNSDYAAKNADATTIPEPWKGLAGNPNIQFVLAKKDPSGKATSGITRTQTTRDGFGTGDSVKSKAGGGHPAWAANRYLNLWVCTLSDGLLGYAQFPGGPARTDGVVILNTAFGTTGTATAPFNLGRTATHEIGHWLNLRHIWGDRNDCGGTDCYGHAQRPASELREADVSAPLLQQWPERRHVHELHGLRRRRRDGHVHAWTSRAHERNTCGAAKKILR